MCCMPSACHMCYLGKHAKVEQYGKLSKHCIGDQLVTWVKILAAQLSFSFCSKY